MYFFFEITEIYESLQVLLLKRTLSNQSIPVNVTNLKQFNLLNACIAISTLRLPRWRWPVMRLQAYC